MASVEILGAFAETEFKKRRLKNSQIVEMINPRKSKTARSGRF